jgi:dipeptidase D
MILKDLQPHEIWFYFEEICKIPRPSKKEEKIIDYLLNFAKQNNLQAKRDETGNVLITKSATEGMENKKTTVLQSHVDMVCEKNSSTQHDFDSDPIIPYIEDGWIKARGTTLGADDGIGMAAQLAILASDNIKHGPLECLFTVDEETGLTGAYQLKPDFFKGDILLNLDSEDEGIIFIGCAGGMDTTGYLTAEREIVPNGLAYYRIVIKGLKGGHSGDDIGKGLGNSIKILTRILWESKRGFGLKIVSLNGGNLRNAIAREAFAEIAIPAWKADKFIEFIEKISVEIKQELNYTENKLEILLEDSDHPVTILKEESANKLLNLLYGLPHGVMSMSTKIEDLVETSTNLASIKPLSADQFEIWTSQRSSSNSLKGDIVQKVSCTFNLAKAKITHSTGYPGWDPNPHSPMLAIAKQCYTELFKKEPIATAIHAGLECGLFLEKYPKLDMISFGPDVKGVHSPDERLNIESVDRFWSLLLLILKNIPNSN